MFGKGRIDIAIQKSHYAPGDIISGNVALTLKKPVKAREASISLIGEHKTTQTSPGAGGSMGGGGMSMSTTTRTVRIYDFKQQLDNEKEYSQNREYHFEMKIPADTMSMGPQISEVEGKLGQVLKLAQTAAAMTGAIPFQRIKWYLLAKLDIPGGFDVSKKVDITIG
jgi:2',3'-cyclic-nucleotide 2'-phosphodiesterase (5'-nucleotidase family)